MLWWFVEGFLARLLNSRGSIDLPFIGVSALHSPDTLRIPRAIRLARRSFVKHSCVARVEICLPGAIPPPAGRLGEGDGG
jgi:hypothetical protein